MIPVRDTDFLSYARNILNIPTFITKVYSTTLNDALIYHTKYAKLMRPPSINSYTFIRSTVQSHFEDDVIPRKQLRLKFFALRTATSNNLVKN